MNINIKLTRSENASYHNTSVGTIITMDIEEYLRGVVPSEVYPSWHAEALKALLQLHLEKCSPTTVKSLMQSFLNQTAVLA